MQEERSRQGHRGCRGPKDRHRGGFPGLCPVGQRQEFGVDSKCLGFLGLILSAWALWFSVSFIPLIFCREQVLLS